MPDERRLWIVRLTVVAGFAALALLAIALLRPASGGGDTPAATPAAGDATPGEAAGEYGPTDDRYAEIGSPAPRFRLLMADGVTPFELASLRGKPVVLNFWASWCGPCRREMPDINAAYLEGAGAFEVIGVNVKEPDLVARGFSYELDLAFPLVLDLEGTVSQRYRITGLPVTYFVDGEGVVRSVHIGFMTRDTLDARLAIILE